MTPYQYVALRCVPRVQREEFVNVGVVVYCPDESYLALGSVLHERRLLALDAELDVEGLRAALSAVDRICRGESQGSVGVRATAYGVREVKDDLSTRFGLIKAPRSTVLQPGPVHGGVTDNPARTLEHLVERLVL